MFISPVHLFIHLFLHLPTYLFIHISRILPIFTEAQVDNEVIIEPGVAGPLVTVPICTDLCTKQPPFDVTDPHVPIVQSVPALIAAYRVLAIYTYRSSESALLPTDVATIRSLQVLIHLLVQSVQICVRSPKRELRSDDFIFRTTSFTKDSFAAAKTALQPQKFLSPVFARAKYQRLQKSWLEAMVFVPTNL